ncbi:MAG: IS200/IS605 family transposase [Rickettsia endosymbiont of Ixodes persulcatus]|nr:IS200/IS605 family transposase [Rickettsia endosymbiont of Ixodes persulcatus]
MEESRYIQKSHNVTVLIYHLVTPARYRRAIFDKTLDNYLCKICLEIEERYEIRFLESGVDKDHVHFLIQSVPSYSPTKVARRVKSITAKKMFEKFPDLKNKLWGTEFWTNGSYVCTYSLPSIHHITKQSFGELNPNRLIFNFPLHFILSVLNRIKISYVQKLYRQ